MLKRGMIKGMIGMSLLLIFGLSSMVTAETALTLWDWHEPRMDLYKQKIAEYEELNPEIKFETLTIPWDDFWKKLMAGVAAKKVPDISQFHNSNATTFLNALEPFPEDLFSLEEMREKYIAFDQAFVFKDKFYFFPTGIMSGLIWYNKEIWEEAGLTQGDLPKTWDELRKTAKKLTQYNAEGEVGRAGFAFTGDGNLQYIWEDFKYQQGGWIYAEGGKSVEWNTPAGLKPLRFLRDLIFIDKVTEPGFLPWMEAFGTEKAAMTVGWTWFGGWMGWAHPELEYGVFILPTEDGGNLPARARNNYECGLAVFRDVPEEKKREAFKFIEWLYDDDAFCIELNKTLARVPGKIRLMNHPEIQADPVLGVLAEQAPYTVFPGDRPSWIDKTLTNMEDRIMNGISPEEALRIAQEEGDRAIEENPVTWNVERQYSPPKE